MKQYSKQVKTFALVAVVGVFTLVSTNLNAVGSDISMDGDLTPSGALVDNLNLPTAWDPNSESLSSYFNSFPYSAECQALIDVDLDPADLFDTRADEAVNTYTVRNTNDSGAHSFRQAVLDANAHSGYDKIVFAIPGSPSNDHTIVMESGLLVMDGVAIDGNSQGDGEHRVTIQLLKPDDADGSDPIPGNDYTTYLGFIGSQFEVDGVPGNADGSAMRGMRFTREEPGVHVPGAQNVLTVSADDVLFEGNNFHNVTSTIDTREVFPRDDRVVNVDSEYISDFIFRENYFYSEYATFDLALFGQTDAKLYRNYFFDHEDTLFSTANDIQIDGVRGKVFANRLIKRGDGIEPLGNRNSFGVPDPEDSMTETFCNVMQGGWNGVVNFTPGGGQGFLMKGDHVYNNTVACEPRPEESNRRLAGIVSSARDYFAIKDVLVEDNFVSNCDYALWNQRTESLTFRSNTIVNPLDQTNNGYYAEESIGATLENNTFEDVNFGVFDIVPLFVPTSIKNNLFTTGQEDSPFWDPNFIGILILDYAGPDGGASIESNTVLQPTVSDPSPVPWPLLAGIGAEGGGQNIEIISNTMASESQSAPSEGIEIGFFEPSDGILISDNMVSGYDHGMTVWGSDNRMEDNHIEANAYGIVLGISPAFGPLWAYDNLISGNTITGADKAGVLVLSSQYGHPYSSGNSILGNSIFGNGQDGSFFGIGIDLAGRDYPGDGVTPNDPGDTDVGTNDLQNYPILSGGAAAGNHLKQVNGVLDSLPGTYVIEFFTNEGPNPSGFYEGQYFSGSVEVEISEDDFLDYPGGKPFSLICTGVDPENGCPKVEGAPPLQKLKLTATATQVLDNGSGGLSLGSTSEFSPAVDVVTPGKKKKKKK